MKGSSYTKKVIIIVPVVLFIIASLAYYYYDTILRLFTATRASTAYHQHINFLSMLIFIAFYSGSVLWSSVRDKRKLRSN